MRQPELRLCCLLILSVTVCIAQQGEEPTVVSFPDWPGVPSVQVSGRFFGFQSAVDRDITDGEPAYDYCPFLMKDVACGLYRLYVGGRWLRKGIAGADGDHVLHFISRDGSPGSWFMPRMRPEFWLPQEQGQTDLWYSCNCLEPEVLKVGGTYRMYCQVQGNSNARQDLPGGAEPPGVDRILLFTSDDGFSWERQSTSRGVVVNMDEPAATHLHHEEALYVPWDADGRPYWLYVAADIAGKATGYWRLRSADPATYDWSTRQRAGLAQYGNQIGYIRDFGGAPLFVRITFTGTAAGKTAPSLQFSRDGLEWTWGEGDAVELPGSDDDDRNRNCYFLGLCTLDGAGEIEQTAPGVLRALYAATTCATPVAPEIFGAEIGLGEMTLTVGQ